MKGDFMNTITNFFTEAPSITGMFYAIIGVSLLGILLFNFLPRKIALKLFIPYRIVSHRATLHKKDNKEYDWSAALKKQSILLLAVFVLSVAILFLTSLYGTMVANIGIVALVFFFIIGSFWVDPTKKVGF